eukprot:m.1238202 g.1238202  ORF g.1238202 m.1238202 type:complete len:283 (+) comp24669_c2_seq6:926-1774(+)
MPSCVGALECHPNRPSLIAVGCYDGTVAVLDTAKGSGKETLAHSESSTRAHSEPVTQVHWIVEHDVQRRPVYKLVSLAGDGKVLVWTLPKKGDNLELVSRYIISGSDIRKSHKLSKSSAQTEAGLTCMSFASDGGVVSRFVAGTETGGVLNCDMGPSPSVPSLKGARGTDLGEVAVARMGYAPHQGGVTGLACSPFHRNVFVSASTDGAVHVSSLLERSPIHVIEPGAGFLFDIAWSPVRSVVPHCDHGIVFDRSPTHPFWIGTCVDDCARKTADKELALKF